MIDRTTPRPHTWWYYCKRLGMTASLPSDSMGTHLLGGGPEVHGLLLAGMLHHLGEDALGVLQKGVGLVVGLDLPRVQHLDTQRPLRSNAAPW